MSGFNPKQYIEEIVSTFKRVHSFELTEDQWKRAVREILYERLIECDLKQRISRLSAQDLMALLNFRFVEKPKMGRPKKDHWKELAQGKD